MNSKLILTLLFACVSLVTAQPVLRLHDGKDWREMEESSWQALPRAEVTGTARDGKQRKYSGVPMAEVLKWLGAPAGPTMRGGEMNRAVLITAADGYQVAFSFAELDPSFRKQNVIIADQVDGQPLSEFEGKRMLVCGDELRHSRWIRQITGIVLTRVEAPK